MSWLGMVGVMEAARDKELNTLYLESRLTLSSSPPCVLCVAASGKIHVRFLYIHRPVGIIFLVFFHHLLTSSDQGHMLPSLAPPVLPVPRSPSLLLPQL